MYVPNGTGSTIGTMPAKLTEWVESLIAAAEDAEARDRLLNVVKRLSVHAE